MNTTPLDILFDLPVLPSVGDKIKDRTISREDLDAYALHAIGLGVYITHPSRPEPSRLRPASSGIPLKHSTDTILLPSLVAPSPRVDSVMRGYEPFSRVYEQRATGWALRKVDETHDWVYDLDVLVKQEMTRLSTPSAAQPNDHVIKDPLVLWSLFLDWAPPAGVTCTKVEIKPFDVVLTLRHTATRQEMDKKLTLPQMIGELPIQRRLFDLYPVLKETYAPCASGGMVLSTIATAMKSLRRPAV